MSDNNIIVKWWKNTWSKYHAKRAKELKQQINREAEHRYSIVKRDGEVFLTLDGERISTDYTDKYYLAVEELLLLRDKYITNTINRYENE